MVRRKKDEEVEVTIDGENYGDISSYVLGMFGITQENMKSVKSILNMIRTVEYSDRTEVEVSLKKIKIIISK